MIRPTICTQTSYQTAISRAETVNAKIINSTHCRRNLKRTQTKTTICVYKVHMPTVFNVNGLHWLITALLFLVPSVSACVRFMFGKTSSASSHGRPM